MTKIGIDVGVKNIGVAAVPLKDNNMYTTVDDIYLVKRIIQRYNPIQFVAVESPFCRNNIKYYKILCEQIGYIKGVCNELGIDCIETNIKKANNIIKAKTNDDKVAGVRKLGYTVQDSHQASAVLSILVAEGMDE